MARIRLRYVNSFTDRHGKLRHYFRRPGTKSVRLPGIPGSSEFMAAYQAALQGTALPHNSIGKERTVEGTVHALVAAYLDCLPSSSSPFRLLAAETQRTQRNILERFREAQGEKRIYTTDRNGQRSLLLTRQHFQRLVNEKSNTPSAQRNFLKALRAVCKWAVQESRMPDDPTVGVTRRKIKTKGFKTWSEPQITQYRQKHSIGSMARLAIELFLATSARRGDAMRLGPQHMHDGGITGKIISFTQSKTNGPVTLPLHPDFLEALAAMPSAQVVTMSSPNTFVTTNAGHPFETAASFGNWFRDRCDEAGLPKGFSAHGLRKATGVRLAHLRCSTHQIAAVLGHTTLSEVERYTRDADRTRLADEAMNALIEGKT
jgi:integrase